MGNTGASKTASSASVDQQPDSQQQTNSTTINSKADTVQNVSSTTDNASTAPVSVQNNSMESRTATTAFSSSADQIDETEKKSKQENKIESSTKTTSKQSSNLNTTSWKSEKPNSFNNSNGPRTTPSNEISGFSGRSTTYSVPNTQPNPPKNNEKFSIQRSNSKESETSLAKSEVLSERMNSKASIDFTTKRPGAVSPARASLRKNWYKWNQNVEPTKTSDENSINLAEEAMSPEMTIPSPPPTIQEVRSPSPVGSSIVAVPSYPLRSTAVAPIPKAQIIDIERAPSVNLEPSIFTYYLPRNDGLEMIGSHTKATMFNMDTRSKITPRPAPSLVFLSKNFSDGLDETDTTNNGQAPSFLSLGLGSDSEIDMKNQPLKAFHPDSVGKDQGFSSQINQQLANPRVNSIKIKSPTNRNNNSPKAPQPLPSILKKTSFQTIADPSLQVGTSKKITFDSRSSIVSFNLPPIPTKTTASIQRSYKLFSNSSFG